MHVHDEGVARDSRRPGAGLEPRACDARPNLSNLHQADGVLTDVTTHEIPQRRGQRRRSGITGARAGHLGGICHILAMLALVTGACVAQTGWQRDPRRACTPEDPPRLCLLAGPDAQQVVQVGGAALVPGECATGPRARSGRIEVRARDGRSGDASVRRLRVRRGQTAMISAVDGDVVVHERRACEVAAHDGV